jgi:acetoin utilization deacetylase AcuC-like enzyme
VQLWTGCTPLQALADLEQASGHVAAPADAWPQDAAARRGIDVDVQLRQGCTSDMYLQSLRTGLDSAFAAFSPDLVIHNAGSDILVGDPLGRCVTWCW